jgi:hypothetical protein
MQLMRPRRKSRPQTTGLDRKPAKPTYISAALLAVAQDTICFGTTLQLKIKLY